MFVKLKPCKIINLSQCELRQHSPVCKYICMYIKHYYKLVNEKHYNIHCKKHTFFIGLAMNTPFIKYSVMFMSRCINYNCFLVVYLFTRVYQSCYAVFIKSFVIVDNHRMIIFCFSISECLKLQKITASNGVLQKRVASEVTAGVFAAP